jgi:hypothetical protein
MKGIKFVSLEMDELGLHTPLGSSSAHFSFLLILEDLFDCYKY